MTLPLKKTLFTPLVYVDVGCVALRKDFSKLTFKKEVFKKGFVGSRKTNIFLFL